MRSAGDSPLLCLSVLLLVLEGHGGGGAKVHFLYLLAADLGCRHYSGRGAELVPGHLWICLVVARPQP